MPASLKRALADPFAFGEHPDLPWKLPEVLPAVADLRAGVKILEEQLVRVTTKHASYCLSKLLVGFNERKTADEAKLLLAVWLEANGDVPVDLWSSATIELLQTHKFGMPKPVHFRECVAARMGERTKALKRALAMLAKVGEPVKPAPFVREADSVRLRASRNTFRRLGNLPKAAQYERLLARTVGREPHAWANDVVATMPAARELDDRPPPLKPLPATEAALKRSLARSWRQQGFTARADALMAEAQALAPMEQFEPEAAHG